MIKIIPDIRIKVGDCAITFDGKQHTITKIDNPVDVTYSLIYLDEKYDREDAYCIERMFLDRYDVDSVAKYFWRVGNYFICTAETRDCGRMLYSIQSALRKKIQAIDATIQSYLESESANGTLEFLKCLYAEAKGLREADKIVVDKLKELTKEDNNVAQKK